MEYVNPEDPTVQYLAAEDSRTLRKIGINVAVLVGVTFALIVVAAVLT